MKLPRWLLWISMAVLVLALVAAQSWVTYRLFTSRFPGGNDFYSRWANGCALIWTGENPYSEDVTVRTQIGMQGHPSLPGQDRAAYAYPLYALFFFWPLCFIPTYPLVQAIWMTLMLYTLLAGVALTGRVSRWQPPAWLWGVTLVWAVLNYPHARALMLGQMATLVFLAFTVALWALRQSRDGLAGALLAVTTIKPQMSFLLLPWFLWWSAWRGRWRVWLGFALAMVLLVGLSFLLVPTWMGDFVAGMRNYNDSWTQTYTPSDSQGGGTGDLNDCSADENYRSLVWIIVRYWLGLGPVVEAVVVIVFAALTLLEAWQGRQAEWSGFLRTTGAMLVLTAFLAPRTATTHYSMLLLPLFLWFTGLQQRDRRGGAVLVLAIQLALLVGQWAIFLGTIQGNYETAWVYLPFPLLLLAVQVLCRVQRSPLKDEG